MKQFKKSKFSFYCIILHFGLNYIYLSSAYSAACCARSSAAPFLILGDDEAQVNLGYSFAKVLAEPAAGGVPVWIESNREEVSQSFRVDGALLLTDRLQVGTSMNLVTQQISVDNIQSKSTGIGDLRISIGYEVLPAWTYSLWKPQGYLYTVITLPTGRSQNESKSGSASDVTGNGFYSTSFGSLWLKKWSELDGFLTAEIHYSLPRSFHTPRGEMTVTPGFGGSMGVGLGYSPGAGNLRIGMRIQPNIDQNYKKKSNFFYTSNKSKLASRCDVGIDLGYMLGDSNTILASYTDQTILGPAANLNLSRTFGLSIQHRWER